MEQRFEKLVKWSLTIPAWLLFLLSLLLLVANNFMWPIIARHFGAGSIFRGTKRWADIFHDKSMLMLYAPIIETLIFQYLLLHLLLKFLRPWVAVTTAGLVFGILHFYNPYYSLAAMLAGFIFAIIFYAYWKGKGELFEALLLVILVHSSANAISFFANQ